MPPLPSARRFSKPANQSPGGHGKEKNHTAPRRTTATTAKKESSEFAAEPSAFSACSADIFVFSPWSPCDRTPSPETQLGTLPAYSVVCWISLAASAVQPV